MSLLGIVISLATFGVAASARAVSVDPASCPLKSSSVTPPGEAWAFTDSGAPSSPHPGIGSSYTHGRGTWGGGRGSGTICVEDSLSAGASHNLVLAVAGQARISPEITRLGHLGVGLVLKVSVSASDDRACTTGTAGTVTLFASYYQGHHDSVEFHFAAACAAYDYSYSGSQVHALIADDGHQVN